MKSVYKAYAKVNLGLDVIRKREDGYHDVKMIMQTVDLYDVITAEATESGIEITSNADFVPCDESNLMYKAAKLLFDEFSINKGIRLQLEKNIPVAAGMAGGSTDAAAVLKAVNEIYKLELPDSELMKYGVRIGADVPYCIMGGTALSEGIGEVLTRIDGMPKCSILIAKPPIGVSTKFVYENLHAESLTYHPDIDAMIEYIRAGDLNNIAKEMGNVLETVTVREYPEIDKIKQFIKERGALNALMSGSGPTVFGLFNDDNAAKAAYDDLNASGMVNQLFLTKLH